MRSGADLRAASPLVSFNHVIDPHFVAFSSNLYTTICNPKPKPNPNPNLNSNPDPVPNPDPNPNPNLYPNPNRTVITDLQIGPRDLKIVTVQIRPTSHFVGCPLISTRWMDGAVCVYHVLVYENTEVTCINQLQEYHCPLLCRGWAMC